MKIGLQGQTNSHDSNTGFLDAETKQNSEERVTLFQIRLRS